MEILLSFTLIYNFTSSEIFPARKQGQKMRLSLQTLRWQQNKFKVPG